MMRVALLALLLAACASASGPQVQQSVGTSTVVGDQSGRGQVNIAVDKVAIGGALPFTVDAAWKALPSSYKALGLSIEFTDEKTHTVGHPRITARSTLGDARMSTYLRCGEGIAGAFADTYRIRMNIRTQLSRVAGDSTMVQTVVAATATPVQGAASGTVECTSTGMLEQAIRRRLLWETLGIAVK